MKQGAFVGASVVAAVAASSCCILPIVFALAGASVAGASAAFAAWRPYLLGLTFGLLGAGFYLAHRKPRQACEPGSACAVPAGNRSGRIGLWMAAVAVVVFAAFPYYSAPVAEFLLSAHASRPALAEAPPPRIAHASIAVEGMDCPACAATVEKKLKEVSGVRKASVSHEQGKVEIEFDPGSASLEQLARVIEDAGFRVRKN